MRPGGGRSANVSSHVVNAVPQTHFPRKSKPQTGRTGSGRGLTDTARTHDLCEGKFRPQTPPSTSLHPWLPCSQLGSLEWIHLCGNIEGGAAFQGKFTLCSSFNLCLDTLVSPFLCISTVFNLTQTCARAALRGGAASHLIFFFFFFINNPAVFLLYLHQQAFLPTFFVYDGRSRMCENNLSSTHRLQDFL